LGRRSSSGCTVCMCMCVCVCVRACRRVCVCMCVCVCSTNRTRTYARTQHTRCSSYRARSLAVVLNRGRHMGRGLLSMGASNKEEARHGFDGHGELHGCRLMAELGESTGVKFAGVPTASDWPGEGLRARIAPCGRRAWMTLPGQRRRSSVVSDQEGDSDSCHAFLTCESTRDQASLRLACSCPQARILPPFARHVPEPCARH
jgi:hypothetical protein